MGSVKEKPIKNKGPYGDFPQQSNPPQAALPRSIKDYNQTVADAEMDLVYADYLQMIFMESEAKIVLMSRSHHAMETFHKMYCLIKQYDCRIKSQAFSLQTMSILIKIYEHIQKQGDVLNPLIEIIPTVAEKYKNLAEAVNVLKNKLHTRDIQVLKPGEEGDVCALLEEIRAFIAEFFARGPQYRKVISTVHGFENYVDSCRIITEALKRGLELLVEARSLYFEEASLALPAAK